MPVARKARLRDDLSRLGPEAWRCGVATGEDCVLGGLSSFTESLNSAMAAGARRNARRQAAGDAKREILPAGLPTGGLRWADNLVYTPLHGSGCSEWDYLTFCSTCLAALRVLAAQVVVRSCIADRTSGLPLAPVLTARTPGAPSLHGGTGLACMSRAASSTRQKGPAWCVAALDEGSPGLFA